MNLITEKTLSQSDHYPLKKPLIRKAIAYVVIHYAQAKTFKNTLRFFAIIYYVFLILSRYLKQEIPFIHHSLGFNHSPKNSYICKLKAQYNYK